MGGPAARRVRPGRASIAARLVRAGGAAAVLVLVLDIARMEHFPGQSMYGRTNGVPWAWAWGWEALGAGLIAACLAAVLIVTARWPQVSRVLVGWCAAAAGVALFFTVAPVQVLITVYVAGILAVTARRSPVTPATLAICTAIGAAGGLLLDAVWDHAGGRRRQACTVRPMRCCCSSCWPWWPQRARPQRGWRQHGGPAARVTRWRSGGPGSGSAWRPGR